MTLESRFFFFFLYIKKKNASQEKNTSSWDESWGKLGKMFALISRYLDFGVLYGRRKNEEQHLCMILLLLVVVNLGWWMWLDVNRVCIFTFHQSSLYWIVWQIIIERFLGNKCCPFICISCNIARWMQNQTGRREKRPAWIHKPKLKGLEPSENK